MKKGLISFVLVLTAVNNKFDKLIANFLGNYLYLTLYCPINVQNPPPNPAEKVGRSAPQRSSVCEVRNCFGHLSQLKIDVSYRILLAVKVIRTKRDGWEGELIGMGRLHRIVLPLL